MITLFHGSYDKNLKSINDSGLFGGLFFAKEESSALSHGDHLYSCTLNVDDIAKDQDLELVDNASFRVIFRWLSDTNFNKHEDLLRDLIIYDIEPSSFDQDDVFEALAESDMAEASWFAQKLRGELAKSLGFKAVEMRDEHGTSYLVLPNVEINNYEG